MYDSWLDGEFHFFVFVLDSRGDGQAVGQRSSFAVFAMHPESPEPVSAITVIPTQDGTEAEITDLQPPGGSHLAAYPFREQADHDDRHSRPLGAAPGLSDNARSRSSAP